MGRVAAGLVLFVSLLASAAHATTAPSLSGRIHIDGVLDEYAADEWVLDSTTALPETDRDSGWGRDNDITRVALTWDHEFLYLAVEGRTFDTFLSFLIANRAGGLATLENAGAFRRAIDPGFGVNIMALASPERIPDVVRADDSHPFALVDRAAVPAAVSGASTGPVGFELAVPWSMLTLSSPVRLVAAITGEAGTGAGDAAPDASTAADTDRFVRAVLDRWFEIDADVNGDGVADDGVAPQSAGSVRPGTFATGESAGAALSIDVSPRAFAPDRGESADLGLVNHSDQPAYVSVAVFSLEGERMQALADNVIIDADSGATSSWNGTNAQGAIVRGGTYIVVAQWGHNRGERSGRATAAVVVVR